MRRPPKAKNLDPFLQDVNQCGRNVDLTSHQICPIVCVRSGKKVGCAAKLRTRARAPGGGRRWKDCRVMDSGYLGSITPGGARWSATAVPAGRVPGARRPASGWNGGINSPARSRTRSFPVSCGLIAARRLSRREPARSRLRWRRLPPWRWDRMARASRVMSKVSARTGFRSKRSARACSHRRRGAWVKCGRRIFAASPR